MFIEHGLLGGFYWNHKAMGSSHELPYSDSVFYSVSFAIVWGGRASICRFSRIRFSILPKPRYVAAKAIKRQYNRHAKNDEGRAMRTRSMGQIKEPVTSTVPRDCGQPVFSREESRQIQERRRKGWLSTISSMGSIPPVRRASRIFRVVAPRVEKSPLL